MTKFFNHTGFNGATLIMRIALELKKAGGLTLKETTSENPLKAGLPTDSMQPLKGRATFGFNTYLTMMLGKEFRPPKKTNNNSAKNLEKEDIKEKSDLNGIFKKTP